MEERSRTRTRIGARWSRTRTRVAKEGDGENHGEK